MTEDACQEYTKFEYLYRDSSNFKIYGYVLVDGIISCDEKKMVVSVLESGELFVAEQLGIPALYEKLYEMSDGPTASDHCWHEFSGFSSCTTLEDGDLVWGAGSELLAKFRSICSWDVRFSPHHELN